MPTIPNFPADLLDQHHHWHVPSEHPGAGPGRTHAMGTPGGGLEFLTFHRNYDAQVLAWYNATSFGVAPFNNVVQKAQLVAPWTSVPPELQADGDWSSWSADGARLSSGTPDFATADELGTFIEVGIHNNFLHGATSAAFGESIVGSFHSPQSTLFYKIHGLVDHWWSLWQRRHKMKIKELMKEITLEIDRKRVVIDAKRVIDEGPKNRIAEVKAFADEVKPVGLEAFDDPRELGDPVVNVLNERLQRIESRVFPRAVKTFIQPDERPEVGEHVAKQTAGGKDQCCGDEHCGHPECVEADCPHEHRPKEEGGHEHG